MIIPKKTLIHLGAWFTIPFIIFMVTNDLFYWFSAIGAYVVLGIYYIVIFQRRYLFPAITGLSLALLLTYYII